MKIIIDDLLAKQQTGEMTYREVANLVGIHPQYAYYLGAQALRAKWSEEFIGLSPRVRNTLAAAGINTVEQVARMHTSLELLTLPNLAMKSFNEIGKWLYAAKPNDLVYPGALQ